MDVRRDVVPDGAVGPDLVVVPTPSIQLFAGIGKRASLEMDAAALPSGGEHPRRRGLDAFIRIQDHQLHAAETAANEVTEELSPERLGLGCADRHAQNLAPSIGVDLLP